MQAVGQSYSFLDPMSSFTVVCFLVLLQHRESYMGGKFFWVLTYIKNLNFIFTCDGLANMELYLENHFPSKLYVAPLPSSTWCCYCKVHKKVIPVYLQVVSFTPHCESTSDYVYILGISKFQHNVPMCTSFHFFHLLWQAFIRPFKSIVMSLSCLKYSCIISLIIIFYQFSLFATSIS